MVLEDGTPERGAVLLLVLVGRRPAVGELGDRLLRLPVEETGAVEGVGSALGDDTHETAAGAAELDGGAVGDHREFLDGLLREGERGAALGGSDRTPEEGVVVVGAVHGDVGVDASLAADLDVVALGLGLRFGQEVDELGEVAAVDRQVLQLLGLHRGLDRRVGDLDGRRLARDGDRGRDALELELEVHGRSEPHVQPDSGTRGRLEAGERRRQGVGADGQIDDLVEAVGPRRRSRGVTGVVVLRLDGRSGKSAAIGVADGAAHTSRRDVGLRGRRGSEGERENRDPEKT